MSDELTPDERDALRARITDGARRIRPAGSHRGAWAAAAVAVVLVAGIAAGAIALTRNPPLVAVAPTPSQTLTPSPTATPAVTPAPTSAADAAVIPFDGDCTALLAPEQADAAAGGIPSQPSHSGLENVTPGLSGSVAMLGGIACAWSGVDSPGYAEVLVIPLAAVPVEVRGDGAPICDFTVCRASTVRGDMWVGVSSTPLDAATGSAEGAEAAKARAQAALDVVAAAPAAELRGSPAASRPAGTWSAPDCAALQQTVAATLGMTSPEAGFPTDLYPSGALWDVLVANGLAAWCAWYSYEPDGRVILTESVLQPGIGLPTTDELDAADATEEPVAGADQAWRMPSGQPSDRILAVSGSNRLTVGGDRPAEVAAALLAALDG